MLAALAERVAASPFAEWAAGSAYAYPWANVVHVLALVLLLGGIGLVDLRLLGLFRALPLAGLARALTPLAVAGLLLLALSGSVLFAAEATDLAASGAFRLKLALIAAAVVNALAYRWRYGSMVAEPGRVARIMALASLCLWTSIAVAGRMIAYS